MSEGYFVTVGSPLDWEVKLEQTAAGTVVVMIDDYSVIEISERGLYRFRHVGSSLGIPTDESGRVKLWD
jgi:hypothetical protein